MKSEKLELALTNKFSIRRYVKNSFLAATFSLMTATASAWAQTNGVTDSAGEYGIEGMRSQEFSIGIFIFLICCIIVFTALVIKFMLTGKGKRLKTGEKIMFVWIFIGIVAAVFMGISQILMGQRRSMNGAMN